MILVENKIQFGLGNLNTAYNHISSLFFLNSTLYMPYIKHYAFNFINIYFLIFVNLYFFYEIIKKNINTIGFNCLKNTCANHKNISIIEFTGLLLVYLCSSWIM
jgi:hypothetical protein